MSYYGICDLLIEMKEDPGASFYPFLVDANECPSQVDLSINHISQPRYVEHRTNTIKMSYMNICKGIFKNKKVNWLFEANNGMSIVYADVKYQNVDYYYDNVFDTFQKSIAMGILSPYFHLLIELKLVQQGFTILHAACVEVGGIAYAFTGSSGVGKSSRAKRWCELLSGKWISGDRPAIDGSTRTVYGVPWDGKECIYRNVKRPLAVILKVTRSETTEIREMTEEEKMQLLCEQTFFPLWDSKLSILAMHSLKKLIHQIPIFELCCDITDKSTYESFTLVTESINGKSF